MSRSPLKRTQVYNFFRTRASMIVSRRIVEKKTAEMEKERPPGDADDAVPVAEAIHIELLTTFARHVREDGGALWMVAVDHQLGQFPHIERAVRELDASGD